MFFPLLLLPYVVTYYKLPAWAVLPPAFLWLSLLHNIKARPQARKRIVDTMKQAGKINTKPSEHTCCCCYEDKTLPKQARVKCRGDASFKRVHTHASTSCLQDTRQRPPSSSKPHPQHGPPQKKSRRDRASALRLASEPATLRAIVKHLPAWFYESDVERCVWMSQVRE